VKLLRKILVGVIIFIGISLGTFVTVLYFNYVPPILMYHSITPDVAAGTMLAVTAETFEKQMSFLARHRYNVISVEELAGLIRSKQKIPRNTVALTFDDGYKDNFTYAFPILKKYGLTATFFVIVQEVGRLQQDRVSWDQIREMHTSKVFSIGSHCIGPEPLINLKSVQEVKYQIVDSKKILQQRLGSPVSVFSYPEGHFTEAIRQVVIDAGYQAAVATNPGKGYPHEDIFALKRIRISENAKNMFVYWFESSGYYTFLKERRHK